MWTVCGLLRALFLLLLLLLCLDFNGGAEFIAGAEKWRIDGKFVRELLELPPPPFLFTGVPFDVAFEVAFCGEEKKNEPAFLLRF